MSAPDPIERAAAALRGEEVPSDPDRDAAMIRAALLAGRGRHRNEQRRRAVAAAAIGGALAAAVALWIWRPADEPPPVVDVLNSLTIEDEHRLVATRDARFEVERTRETRVVRLDAGAMLFDVAPLSGGEGFEVHTPQARVIVTGTVFAVEVLERGIAVEVFEGHVRVEDRGASRELAAGESYATDETRAIALLRERGEEAARRRGAVSSAPVAGVVEVDELPRAEVSVGAPEIHEATDRVERAAIDPVPRARRDRPEPEAAITTEQARALIVAGRASEALALARSRAGDAEWRFVEADALRALSRTVEAADAYDDAARGLPRRARVEAAFLAARVRLRELSDAEGALASLDAGTVDAPGSPLRERALALRADALAELGRTSELREVAREYVRDFPLGSSAPRFARIAESAP